MVLYYCAAKPKNRKKIYGSLESIKFSNTTKKGRAVVKGSYSLSGSFEARKVMSDGTIEDISAEDSVFLDPYNGVHSFITTNVNDPLTCLIESQIKLQVGKDPIPFCMKPLCADDKVRKWKLSFRTVGGAGGLYTTVIPDTSVKPHMTAILYYLRGLELHWRETDEIDLKKKKANESSWLENFGRLFRRRG